MRAFIALPLPSSDAAVIEAAQERLPVGRCTDPETLHLTLAFLGEQPIPVLEDLHEILSALHAPAFDLTLSGFISLGGDGGHALALEAEASPALSDLHARIKSRCAGLGLDLPRRRFRPHVTLARLPGRQSPEDRARLAAFLARENLLRLDGIHIDRFGLYGSTLHRDGARHELLETYPLGAAPPASPV